MALGWATVDLERTLAQVVSDARGVMNTMADWLQAPPDELLGARAVRAGLAPVDLVVLEPLTEGRLAAFLARHGEGVGALYVEVDDAERPRAVGTDPPSAERRPPSAEGRPPSAERASALGRPGRVRPAGTGRWGPFLVELSRPRPSR